MKLKTQELKNNIFINFQNLIPIWQKISNKIKFHFQIFTKKTKIPKYWSQLYINQLKEKKQIAIEGNLINQKISQQILYNCMNHQSNTQQITKNFVGYNYEEQRSQCLNDNRKKRQDMHKQIRKKQIEDYIMGKRKMYLENGRFSVNFNNQSVQHIVRAQTLVQCLKHIQAYQNVQENICSLVNILAQKKPFQLFDVLNTQATPQMIEQFCNHMVRVLLYKIIPYFEKYKKGRIFCLTALSNLFADPLCQNKRYVQIVVDTIDTTYGGLGIWNCDQQMIEIYYMISNLLRKNITHIKFMAIEKILAWVQDGILQIPSDPLKCLTDGVIQFFTDIDNLYNSNHRNSLYTDHFRQNRQFVIQNFIKRLIETANGNKLKEKGSISLDADNILQIFKFLNNNKQYVLKIFNQKEQDQQQKHTKFKFIQKIIHLLSQQTIKKQVIHQMGRFIVSLLKYFPDIGEVQVDQDTQLLQQQIQNVNSMVRQFHQYFLKQTNMLKILKNLSYQNIDCKLIYLKMIYQLFSNIEMSCSLKFTDKQIFDYLQTIMVDKSLEIILMDYIQDMNTKLRDLQILKVIMVVGNGYLGLKIKYKLQNLLHQNNAFIPQQLYEIIDEQVNLHNQHINKLQIDI